MDKIMKNTGKPWNKQRERTDRDGHAKVGCQHNEDANLKGSLTTAGKFLDKADSLDDYHLAGSYGGKN